MLGITDHGKQSPRLAREHPWSLEPGATDTILIAMLIGCPGSVGDRPSLLMLVYGVMGVRQCERQWCVCMWVCACVADVGESGVVAW